MRTTIINKSISVWPLYLLFFTSVDTILFGTNGNRAFLFVPRILGAIFIVGLPLIVSRSFKNIRYHTKDVFVLLTMVAIIILSSTINHDNIETALSKIIFVMLAYSISHVYSKEVFAKVFDGFMAIVSYCAIITEIISYLVPGIIRYLPSVINTAGNVFHTYFFGAIEGVNLTKTIIRSSGVFWEPGAFAIYLIFAIMLQLFVLDKLNIKRVVLYCIALFITFSTTGYLSFAVLLLAFIFSNKSSQLSRNLKRTFLLIAVLLIIGSIYVESTMVYDAVFSKLTSGSSSATTRYSSFFYGMKVAMDHPFFGVGSVAEKYMAEYVYAYGSIFKNGGTTITNTVVGQFASYGFVFGLLFLLGTIRYLKFYTNSKIELLFLTISILMAYSGEKFFSFYPFVFAFYGLSSKKGEK